MSAILVRKVLNTKSKESNSRVFFTLTLIAQSSNNISDLEWPPQHSGGQQKGEHEVLHHVQGEHYQR